MDEVPIHLHIELLPEGVYLATSKDVPGLVIQADTIADAIEFAKDGIRMIVESCLEHGDPLPPALVKGSIVRELDTTISVPSVEAA